MNAPEIKWLPIETAPHNEYLLLACKSGYRSIDWIYRVGRFTAGWHDRWDDEGGDALNDDGHKPSFWSPLPNQPVL